jgi:hypothetical protein
MPRRHLSDMSSRTWLGRRPLNVRRSSFSVIDCRVAIVWAVGYPLKEKPRSQRTTLSNVDNRHKLMPHGKPSTPTFFDALTCALGRKCILRDQNRGDNSRFDSIRSGFLNRRILNGMLTLRRTGRKLSPK